MMRVLILTICSIFPFALPAEEVTAPPDGDATPALTQLMNSRVFKGLAICTTDPWKGLEYAKNLELEYLQWALTAAQTQEQQALQKQISEFVIKTGRQLQEVREKCLSFSNKSTESATTSKSKPDVPGRDQDTDGIP